MEQPTKRYFCPTKPYTLSDAINRAALATGGVATAIAGEHNDFNGHAVRIWWNPTRENYVAEYQWGKRNVLAISTDIRRVLWNAIQFYAHDGRGASVDITIKAEDAAVMAEFPEVLSYDDTTPDQVDSTWRTWAHGKAHSAVNAWRQLGIPLHLLQEAESYEDWQRRQQEWCDARRTTQTATT